MKCEKCYHCIQVSAKRKEIKCKCPELGYDGVNWEDEPEYCKYYLDKKYTIVKNN